jgi:hypothetical protein
VRSAAGALIAILDTVTIPIEWPEDGAVPPAGPVLMVAGTNGRVRNRDFSNAATQDIIVNWSVPDDIRVSSGIKYKVKGFITAAVAPAAGEGVAFKLSGYSIGLGDAADGAFGAEVISELTDLNASGCAAQYDYFVTPLSAAVTVTNLAAGEQAILHLERDQAEASDDYAQLIGVSELIIEFTRLYRNG